MKKVTFMFFMSVFSIFSGFSQGLPMEGFETWPPSGWGIYNNGVGLVQSWKQTLEGDPILPPYAGTFAARLDRENVAPPDMPQDWLVTPQFILPENAQLSFYTRLMLGGIQGSIYRIMISTNSDPSNLSAYTEVVEWTENQLTPTQSEYILKEVDLPGTAGTPVYVAFVMEGRFMDGWLVDNVQVVEQCLTPTVQPTTGITATSAILNWQNPEGYTDWEIELIPAVDAFTGTGTPYDGVPPYNAGPLTPSTAYKYKVRAVCSALNKSDWSETGTFTTPALPPANDNCANAITLTVNPTNICAVSTSGTVEAATASPEATTCTGTEDDDVWYEFVATNTTHYINLTNVTGTTTDLAHSVYSGTNCAALTQILCSDPNSSTLNGLTVGQTYKIRVYSYSATAQNVDFDICVTTPVTSQPNDECANATVVPVNPDLNCAQTVTASVMAATASAEANTCTGTDDDDVWFEFVATSTTHTITFSDFSGTGTDIVHVLYQGDDCATMTQLYCSDPNQSLAGNLTIGETYKIRVYSWTATANQTAVFTLCIGTPPPPPANDNCANAAVVPVNPDLVCAQTVPGTVAWSTASPEASTCNGTEDDDVWFEFTATSTSHTINFNNIAGSTTNLDHAVYTGNNCGALTLVYCSDGNGSIAGNLTIGQVYKIRVYTNTAATGQTSTFDVCIGTPPPPPVNDNCVNATMLTVNPTFECTAITPGTIAWSTPSPENSTCTGTEDDDVWFEFVATHPIHRISILNAAGSVTDMVHAVYQGDECGSLTQFYCSDADVSTNANFVVGQTYKVRVYTYTANPAQTSTFDVCVGTPPAPPANDECANAITVLTNPDLNCGNFASGTISWATPSVQANTCGGTDDDDVWFSFVATSTMHTINLNNIAGGTTDLFHVLYSGDQCGTLTQLYCSDANASVATNLVIGNTYKIRVYSNSVTPGQTSTFDVCVGTPPPPPANDECANAIVAPVNPDHFCGQIVSGTVSWATASADASTCAGTEDDDVWFQFTATNTTHLINVNNVVGSVTDMVHVLYSGSCGTLTQMYCSDPNNSTATGLVVGQTYYVRVYTYTPNAFQTVTFDLCVGTPPPPPVNDECANAIVAPVNDNSLCEQTTLGTVYSATQSTDTNTCTGTADDDVWFEFTATHTNHYIAILDEVGNRLSTSNFNHAVYTGTCGALTLKYCSDPNNSMANDFVIGQTYKIRIYSSVATPQTFNFRLCIGVPLTCDVATSFCASDDTPGVTFPGSVGVPNYGDISCLNTSPNPTFYFLQIENSGTLNLNLSQTSIYGDPIDVDFIAYGPFDTYEEMCGDLNDGTEVDCSYSASAVEPFTIPNAVAGQYYMVMITNFNGTRGTINFTQTNVGAPGAGSTDCTIVCTADLGDDQILCGETQYVLDSGIINADSYTWSFNGTVIPGATSQTYTATQSGNYSVVITKPTCESDPTDDINLTFLPAVTIADQQPVALCGNGGSAELELTTLTGGALGTLNPADYTVTYHLTEADALAGINAIDTTVPFTTTTQTIYVRVENNLLDTCFDIAPIAITVNTAAAATIAYAGTPYCDNGGIATVTLTGNAGGTYTSTTGLTINAATGAIDLAATTPGTYTVTYTIAATPTCAEFTTTTEVTVVESATISYGNAPYCSNGTIATVTQTGLTGGTYSAAPAGLVFIAGTGNVDLITSTPGVYTVTYTLDASSACPGDVTAQIEIVELPEATISYGTAPYCENSGTAVVTLTGNTGGTFASATGLAINTATGDIDLAASTPGTYTVTYTIAAGNGCPEVVETTTITIDAQPEADFGYASATFCQNAGNAAPVFTGTATAGTFTVDNAGLVIDAATGIINPAASTPGNYVITNTVNPTGACGGDTASVSITIIAAPVGTFAYNEVAYCTNGTVNPSPVLDGVAGNFTVVPAGLAINPATGVIDLANSAAGTYTVSNTVPGTSDCPSVTETTTVTIVANASVLISEDCNENDYTLTAVFNNEIYTEEGVAFSWTDASGFEIGSGISVVIEEPGTYYLTVTPVNAPADCPVVAEVNVLSTGCLIARGISPNNDGKNDNFDLSAFNVTKLSIFNRYGREVYTKTNYTNEWFGQTDGGDELPTGTYFYSFERANGTSKTGWIYINRQDN